MCAHVYISRRFLQLPTPSVWTRGGHGCNQGLEWLGCVSPGEGAKEGPEVPSQWWPAWGQPPVAISFPVRHQAWCHCRPKPGLQGRGDSPGPRASLWVSVWFSPGAVCNSGGTLPAVGDPTLAGRCLPQPQLRVVGVFVFI